MAKQSFVWEVNPPWRRIYRKMNVRMICNSPGSHRCNRTFQDNRNLDRNNHSDKLSTLPPLLWLSAWPCMVVTRRCKPRGTIFQCRGIVRGWRWLTSIPSCFSSPGRDRIQRLFSHHQNPSYRVKWVAWYSWELGWLPSWVDGRLYLLWRIRRSHTA